MRHSVALDNLSKTIPSIDSDHSVALLHAPFKGTTLFGRISQDIQGKQGTCYFRNCLPGAPPQTYSTKPYTDRGKSFKKGGSYRRGGRDRDQSRSTPSATVTQPSKSWGQSCYHDSYCASRLECKVQSNEDAPCSKRPRRAGKPRGDKKQTE